MVGVSVVSHGRVIVQAPPEPERRAGCVLYRDAVVARIVGFRPLMLDLVTPWTKAPVPLVVYIHGGGFASGSNKLWLDPLGELVTHRLIEAGIAVASIQYRLSAEARFPAQVHDVKAALRWLRHFAPGLGLAESSFAAWGESAGGYLAAMLAVTADRAELAGEVGVTGPSSAVQAAVSWYGPANLATMPALGPPELQLVDAADSPESRLLGAPVHTVPDLAAVASPVTYVSATAAPIQLVHGDRDPGVPIGQSEELAAAYERARASVELIRVPGAGHGLHEVDRAALVDVGVRFLRQHLTPRE